MKERQTLLESIAQTTADYRKGEVDAPTPAHVERWIEQFDPPVQLPMLREIDHVLKSTYFSLARVTTFLRGLIGAEKLVGKDPCAFWRSVNFLDIQGGGNSQTEMLGLFNELLQEKCGFAIAQCGKPGGDYVYIDDVMFSGNRVGNDLAPWILEKAPATATVQIIVSAIHSSGEYFVGKYLKNAITGSGKSIQLNYWRAKTIENRKYYRNSSEVLWPAEVPADAVTQQYLALPHKFPLELRAAIGKFGPFSSEEGRRLLEREFLMAGVRIRGLSQQPKDVLRPLGYSPFGVGFGSMWGRLSIVDAIIPTRRHAVHTVSRTPLELSY